MSRLCRIWRNSWQWSTLLVACAWLATPVEAATIVLKDGRRLEGRVGKTSGLAANPLNQQPGQPATITFIDDDLRRVYFPTFQVRAIEEINSSQIPERIHIHQRVAKSGGRVNRVGQTLALSPFDKFGRRVLTMMSDKGKLNVVQGITLITPTYTKVEGLMTAALSPLVWDMRIATSSIPRDTLRDILLNNTSQKNLDARLRVVRLFLQAERYQDAQQELETVLKDFPEQKDLADKVQDLKQLHARSIVREIDVRRAAGQHLLAYNLLDKFPAEGVAGEVLQQVREMLAAYQDLRQSAIG